MTSHDRNDRVGKIDGRQDVRADVHVTLHLLELGGRQLARLVEDVLGHGELPGVMEQRRGLDRPDRLVITHAKRSRKGDGVLLYTADVIVGDAVLRLDRSRQRLDR
jgi:hypothetical protein